MKNKIYVPSIQYNYWASQCKEKGFKIDDDYSALADKILFIESDVLIYSVHDLSVYATLGDDSYFLYHIN